jgi:hypothetical protein
LSGETLKSKSCSKVDAYHLTFEPYGWATAYVDDIRGTLSIVSDWGNYAYRWGVDSLGGGRTLSQFLIDAEPEYIATKLHVDLGGIIDLDGTETKNALKRELLRMRRHKEIEGWEARHEWDELEYWDPEFDQIPPVSFVDNWWDYRRTGHKQTYVQLLTIVIPALKEALYEEKTVCVT